MSDHLTEGGRVRVQILHLPGPDGAHSFALIFDQCDPAATEIDQWTTELRKIVREDIGAKAILVFAGSVEIQPSDRSGGPVL
jgi:hypothetical protein